MKRAKTVNFLDRLDYLERSEKITKEEKKRLVLTFQAAITDETKDQNFYALVEELLCSEEQEKNKMLSELRRN